MTGPLVIYLLPQIGVITIIEGDGLRIACEIELLHDRNRVLIEGIWEHFIVTRESFRYR